VYDGDGRRVMKTTGDTLANGTVTAIGTQTTFVYDAMGQLAAEYSTAVNTDTGTRYLTTDHLGSMRLITDSSGVCRQRLDYVPFGETLSGTVRCRWQRCSYHFAPSVGLKSD